MSTAIATQETTKKEIILPESVLATSPSEDVSTKYRFFSTKKAVDFFTERGWKVHSATQSRTSKEGKKGFTRHTVVLVPESSSKVATSYGMKFAEGTPTITLINSHDGSSSLQVLFGMMIKVCQNGLIAPRSVFPEIRVRHTDNEGFHALQEVLVKAESVFTSLFASLDSMKAVKLDTVQQEQFAQEAIILLGKEGRLDAVSVLKARNTVQVSDSLYDVFNRVQESVIRGGLQLEKVEGQKRTTKTREVKAIDRRIDLNQKLWELAMKFQSN